MAKVLGLDLGTNSLGWALVDESENEYTLIDKGVDIFQEGVARDKNNEKPAVQDRTSARALRRHYFRRRLRKIELLKILIRYDLCPPLPEELLTAWQKEKRYPQDNEFLRWQRTDDNGDRNPYHDRYVALSERLDLGNRTQRWLLGRALYHLAQRRGFLSNLKEAGNEKEDGTVKECIKNLSAEIAAAGSLVSYLLGITDIDPIEYNLSFERFLNPKRVTMPDIDMDFEDDRRDEIVDYLTKKYGPSRTAKIITFGSYKARSAIKASGLSLNIQPQRLKQLSDSLPNYGIVSTSLSDAYKSSIRLQKLCSDSYYKRIFDIAKSIESLPTNPSIHAAGVIISNIDIYRQAQMSEGTSGIVEYEYPNMERMGFLKVDLLSLHYLTIIKNIEEIMKEEGHKIPNYQSLKDDPETYKTINSLDLSLIFQLDGNSGMKQAIKEIKPSNYNDLVALIALYRPGPKDNIPTYAKNKHSGVIPSSGYKEVDEILKDTYGVLVYQEQILKLAHDIAGMDMGEADLLRRAISKKHLDDMEKYKSRFIQGAQKHGLSLNDTCFFITFICL